MRSEPPCSEARKAERCRSFSPRHTRIACQHSSCMAYIRAWPGRRLPGWHSRGFLGRGLAADRAELGPRAGGRIAPRSSRRTGWMIPPGAKHTHGGSGYRQVRERLSRSSRWSARSTCATFCRRSACRHWLCIGRRTSGTPRAAATSVRTSRARKSSNFRAIPTSRTSETKMRSSTRSRSSSPAFVRACAGSRSGDRALHRHRFLDGARRRARRRCVDADVRPPRRPVAREVERHVVAESTRRVTACSRPSTARACRAMRASDLRGSAVAGHRSASGTSHR